MTVPYLPIHKDGLFTQFYTKLTQCILPLATSIENNFTTKQFCIKKYKYFIWFNDYANKFAMRLIVYLSIFLYLSLLSNILKQPCVTKVLLTSMVMMSVMKIIKFNVDMLSKGQIINYCCLKTLFTPRNLLRISIHSKVS